MIRVQVESAVVEVKSGTSARTGNPYSIREQDVWAYLSGRDGKALPHPQRVRITLDDSQTEPYPVGEYVLDPASIYVGDYSQLQIRARLRRVNPVVQRAA